jgi:superfamily II DNA or RNA helicase
VESHLSLGDPNVEVIRQRAKYLSHAHQYDELSSVSSSRIDPMPHQIFATYRATKKIVPTMILADEVGLGKTIEAALILKELRARKLVERVLVLTPASLTLQWQGELAGKFNEQFEVFDGSSVKHFGRGNKNAWLERDLVIASLNFATGKKQAENIVAAGWDLVIVDEAHKVRRQMIGRSFKETVAYTLVNDLKDSSTLKGLLLLTATPMQLHEYELYSLIELIEPGLYPTFNSYLQVASKLPQMNNMMREYLKWKQMSSDQRQNFLNEFGDFLAELGMVVPDLQMEDVDAELDILAKKHPLSEVMIRNRKKELEIQSERIARKFLVRQSPEEEEVYSDVETYLRFEYDLAQKDKNNAIGFLLANYYRMLTSSSASLRTSMLARKDKLEKQLGTSAATPTLRAPNIGEIVDPIEATDLDGVSFQTPGGQAQIQREINTLKDIASKLGKIKDSKAQALIDILKAINTEEPGAKVLIFTQFIVTQNYLRDVLQRQHGYDVAIFNGRLRADEKEHQIARFRSNSQILISTEAGGEGRNLQFSHYLINYDLPWNPMKVEQRIGRLDRIGQTHPVVIYNLAYEGTVESRVLEILTMRIGIFERSVGSLDPILGDVESNIREAVLLDARTASAQLEKLGSDLEKQILDARAADARRDDLMMDRMSLRRDYVNKILETGPMADHLLLKEILVESLPDIGGEIHSHPEGGYQVVLGRDLSRELGIHEGRILGTFDPSEAASATDLEFLAFGNQYLDALIAHMAAIPNTGMGAREVSDVGPGEYLEVVYQFRFGGLQPLANLIRVVAPPEGEIRYDINQKIDVSGKPYQASESLWVEARFADIEKAAEQMQIEFREQCLNDFARIQNQEKLRVSRVYEQMRIKNQESLDDNLDWWQRNAKSEDPKIQKILPARKGRIEKLKNKNAAIANELETTMARIDSKMPEIEFEILWTSLVRGE